MRLLLCALQGTTLWAQLPAARLEWVFPPGAAIGSTNAVITLAGENLEDTRAVLLMGVAGVETVPVQVPGQEEWGERATVRLAIPSSARAGIYDIRVVSRYGVSNPRRFVLSDVPERQDSGGESDRAKAIELRAEESVYGRVEAGGSDYVQLRLKAGERIRVECQTSVLDSKLDPVLRVEDPNRREVVRSRSTGELDFVAGVEGVYTLRLHDFLNQGGDPYFYRLMATKKPRIDFVLPGAVVLGESQAVKLVGRNLPGGKPWVQQTVRGAALEYVEVSALVSTQTVASAVHSSMMGRAAGGWMDRIPWMPSIAGTQWVGAPLLMGVAEGPVVMEKEPNSPRAQAQVIALPCDVTGQLYPRGDQDWYRLQGKKGEVWVVETISHRLGTGVDPFLYVCRVSRNDKGVEKVEDEADSYDMEVTAGDRDFQLGTGDALIRYEVKADGEYRILIRDQAQSPKEDGSRVYRLSVRKERPDFELAVAPVPPPPANKDARDVKVWSTSGRRGGVVPLRVWAWRREGMNQPIEITVTNLPVGVRCVGGVIPAGQNSVLLTLDVATNAAAWGGYVQIVGKAKQGEKEWVRKAVAGSMIWPVGDFNVERIQNRAVDGIGLGVIDRELVPFRMMGGTAGVVEACPGIKVSVPIRWESTPEVQGKAKLKLLGHPALGGGKDLEVEAKPSGQSQFEVDLSQTVIPVGEHWLHVQGQVTCKYVKDEALVKKIEEEKKGNEEMKKKAEERAKRAAARDIAETYYSPATLLRVLSAPLHLNPVTNQVVLATNSQAMVKVQLERLFGFADAVDLQASFQDKIAGLDVEGGKVVVAKDAAEGSISVKAGMEVKPGEYPLSVKASVKMNGQDMAMTRTVTIRVP